jgi:hypothetical protein
VDVIIDECVHSSISFLCTKAHIYSLLFSRVPPYDELSSTVCEASAVASQR